MRKTIFQKLAITTLGVTLSFGVLEASLKHPAVGVSLYTITDLGTLGGDSYGSGINNLGQVIGNSGISYKCFSSSEGTHDCVAYHAFRTAANSAINPSTDDIGLLGGINSFPHGINDSGQVAGGDGYAFRTAANSAINLVTDNLGTLGGVDSSGYSTGSFAYGINNSGQVVGNSGTVSGVIHAFRTAANSAINPATDDLGTLGGSSSNAYGINSSGQVIGDSLTVNGVSHAFRTAANSAINLATDDLGTLGGIDSYAYGINNSGQVVGSSAPFNVGYRTSYHAFRTAANSAINPATDDLGTLGGSSSTAFGVNSSGQVVGDSLTANGDDHAFLYDGNGMYDLNSLASNLDGFSFLGGAFGINDSGQIAGTGFLPDGSRRAFLATPVSSKSVPEPSNSAALGILILGFLPIAKKLSSKKPFN